MPMSRFHSEVSVDTPASANLADPNARQVGGAHYSKSGYQHWDYASDLHMRHLEGSATKYLARAGNKAEEPRLKDLEKAAHYLEKLAHLYHTERIKSLRQVQANSTMLISPSMATALLIKNSMSGQAFTPRLVGALVLLSDWSDGGALAAARDFLEQEIQEERAKPQPEVGCGERTIPPDGADFTLAG